MTTSLELSKALKEAGWSQNLHDGLCCFAYQNEELHLIHDDNDTGWRIGNDYSHHLEGENGDPPESEYIVAPTAEAILEKLPKEIVNHFGDNERQGLMIGREEYGWTVYYNHCSNLSRCMDVEAETLADACAKMWLYLKSHNLLPQ